ncbi:MAG: enoyl-CoA hydratase/isomerase family protein [Halobacteriovoraceae bacterium]|nr:enoyl-CoA hydratase/isomerase family protein [Halobacteriovoraceae bacterium]
MNKIIFSEKNGWGIITLNAPKALNSLDLSMIKAMDEKLRRWREDKNIHAVILEGEGPKAFCAGGDVVSLYHSMVKKDPYADDFFKNEYELDQLIHNHEKPIVCFAGNIVMGGGIGIMNGCSHRIVSETTKMAMPEITIGLFPDVGGSYFLNKAPDGTGLYLALTATRFDGADALFINMADSFVKQENFPPLKEKLLQLSLSEAAEKKIDETIEDFSSRDEKQIPQSQIKNHMEEIENLTSVSSIKEFHIKAKDLKSTDKWIQRGLAGFSAGSPTSAAVIFEQLKRGKELSLKEAFIQEYNLARQCVRHHDFSEGVRALLVDKDNNPRWSPDSIEKVGPSLVEEHFKAP